LYPILLSSLTPFEEEIIEAHQRGFRSNMSTAWSHSVQNVLSSSFLSNNIKIKINKAIILPFVLYGCETWSLTLREERRLWVFENRLLRKIVGPKRDEVTGEWRKLHNEVLNVLHCTPNIIRVIKSRKKKWTVHVAHMGGRRDTYMTLVGKPQGKSPLKKPRRRCEDNIKMDLQKVGWGEGLIDPAQDRDRWWTLVNPATNLRVPLNTGNFFTS
jgi:hypothetical protein